MNNLTVRYKIKQRLNKEDSLDYDNIPGSRIIEAIHKAATQWCRRQLVGTNLKKTSDEQTKRRISDLQILLKTIPLPLLKKDGFYQSLEWPADYFEYKRISVKATTECCGARAMKVYLAEEENVDLINDDDGKQPDFEWGHTYSTLHGNTIKIHTDNKFDLENAKFTYYRQPRLIEFAGVSNPYTGLISPQEVELEFKDDIVEVIIDEAVKIIAGDIQDGNTNQIADNSVETNN